ncbi:MAG: FAD-dependent monooxygenase [Oceanococcaceae bacterium]
MQVDLLVAGGGCVGWLLAGLAARQGVRVALVAPEPLETPLAVDLPPLARVIALAPDIEQALLQAGVPSEPWQRRGCPVTQMHVSVPGQGQVRFGQTHDAAPLARIVEVAALQQAIQQWAVSTGVRHLPERVGTRHASGVELDSGVRITAPLVAACDGSGSPLRRQMGISVAVRDYEQTAIVSRLRFADAPRGEARQTMRADSVLGVLPLVDGTLSAVWSLANSQAQYWRDESDAAFADGLNLALEAPWGAAELLGARQSFPLRGVFARSLHAHGLCLLGDAAHTVHPLAGLGLNLGLADALTLERTLARTRQSRRPLNDPALLDRWSRERTAQVQPYRLFIDALAGLGHQHSVAWRAIGQGFAVVDRWSALRQFFEIQARRGSLPAAA